MDKVYIFSRNRIPNAFIIFNYAEIEITENKTEIIIHLFRLFFERFIDDKLKLFISTVQHIVAFAEMHGNEG